MPTARESVFISRKCLPSLVKPPRFSSKKSYKIEMFLSTSLGRSKKLKFGVTYYLLEVPQPINTFK